MGTFKLTAVEDEDFKEPEETLGLTGSASRQELVLRVYPAQMGITNIVPGDISGFVALTTSDASNGEVVTVSERGRVLVGQEIRASLTDEDQVVEGSESLQWQRSLDKPFPKWENMSGVTSNTYKPTDDDIGYLLRAIVTYIDKTHEHRPTVRSGSALAVQAAQLQALTANFSSETYNTSEGDEDGVLVTVLLNESVPVGDPLVLPIMVVPGEIYPASGDDFTLEGLKDWGAENGSGTLSFATGEDKQSFTIKASQDILAEENETLELCFGTELPEGLSVGETASATVIIEDDDGLLVKRRIRCLNAAILSRHALTIGAQEIDAISERVATLAGGSAEASNYRIAGQSTLYDALAAKEKVIDEGILSAEEILSDSSFILPLLAASEGTEQEAKVFAVWGGGNLARLEGETDCGPEWDGDVLSAHLGVDRRIQTNLLTGMSLSWSQGNFDYRETLYADSASEAEIRGDYESQITSVHPYVGWLSPEGLQLWATLGFGRGNIRIVDDQMPNKQASNTTLKMVAMGARGALHPIHNLFTVGTTTLLLRGDALMAQVEVEGNRRLIDPQTVEGRRFRVVLEGSHQRVLVSGAELRPSLELGIRHDHSDGGIGAGIEFGGSVRYLDPLRGLTVEGAGRILAFHQADQQE